MIWGSSSDFSGYIDINDASYREKIENYGIQNFLMIF